VIRKVFKDWMLRFLNDRLSRRGHGLIRDSSDGAQSDISAIHKVPIVQGSEQEKNDASAYADGLHKCLFGKLLRGEE
jgi:hypothetical protein